MTAIALAEKTMKVAVHHPYKDLLEFFSTRYEVSDPTTSEKMSAEGIMKDPLTKEFLKGLLDTKTSRDIREREPTEKKVSPNPDERCGQYDSDRCDARIWKEKPRSGCMGYDNIQCSSKKVNGCLCNKHFKMQEEGNLWTGLITDPRPENPIHPTAGPGRTPIAKMWSTDKDGHEIEKTKNQTNVSKKKANKSHEDMDVAELEKHLQRLQKEKKCESLMENHTSWSQP